MRRTSENSRPGCSECGVKWRAAGNNPPRTDPFYVPDNVAEIARRQAEHTLARDRLLEQIEHRLMASNTAEHPRGAVD